MDEDEVKKIREGLKPGDLVVTAGEGGACATQDDEIAERLWSYRNCGRSKTSAGPICHY